MKLKKVFFLLLVLGGAPAFGQSQKPEIIAIKTIERIFSGSIANKYPITIYLKFQQFSDDHDGIYSVKGWYYYDSKKTKIPLVGVYDGGMTLFNIASAEKQKQVLEIGSGEMIWDALEKIKNLEGYDEKFSIANGSNPISGTWTKGKTALGVTVDGSDMAVYKLREFLQIPNGKEMYSIDLYDLNLYVTDLHFNAIYRSKDSCRALLEYEFTSRPNHQGMCGAGTEKGYITLHFNSKMDFLSAEDFRIESCLNNIMYETDTKDATILTLQPFETKKERYKIDAANAQIIKLKS